MIKTMPMRAVRRFLMAAGLISAPASVVLAYDVGGFVVDESNRPVRDATVALEGSDIAAVTDSLGTFRLTGVGAGTYTISVRASCALTARIPDVRVPRPVQVPMPIEVLGVDCRQPAGPEPLGPEDLRELLASALADAIAPERRPLALALISDGAIELRSRNAPVEHVHLAQSEALPVTTAAATGAAMPPATVAPLSVDMCVRVLDAGHALVWLGLHPAPAPFELAVFRADQALLTLERRAGGWTIIHALYCLSEAPPDLPRRRLPDLQEPPPRR